MRAGGPLTLARVSSQIHANPREVGVVRVRDDYWIGLLRKVDATRRSTKRLGSGVSVGSSEERLRRRYGLIPVKGSLDYLRR